MKKASEILLVLIMIMAFLFNFVSVASMTAWLEELVGPSLVFKLSYFSLQLANFMLLFRAINKIEEMAAKPKRQKVRVKK